MKLSIITVAYNMPRQAMNTVYSLSARHQKNVCEDDYEIILMENESGNNIDPDKLLRIGKNIRYFRRGETSQSPTPAINEAFSLCRSDHTCFIIDAARMVTPRVVEYALMAKKISPSSIFSVPSYNLGPCEHQFHNHYAYDQTVEKALLHESRWQTNGYRLFDICNISEANQKGIFHPIMECNLLSTSYRNFESIGFANPAFMLPGGGSVNLHMYRSVATQPSTTYCLVAPGEGSFHQFHAGITTKSDTDREGAIAAMRTQLNSFWNGHYQPVNREPFLLGAIGKHATPFLKNYSQLGRKRFQWRIHGKRRPWPDEPTRSVNHNFDN